VQGLARPGTLALKKHCNRIVTAQACAVRGLSEHCQATDAIVAASPIRAPPQADPHPDYSPIITDSFCMPVNRRIIPCLLLTGDPYHPLIFSPSGYHRSDNQATGSAKTARYEQLLSRMISHDVVARSLLRAAPPRLYCSALAHSDSLK